jgi:hypothetical protein
MPLHLPLAALTLGGQGHPDAGGGPGTNPLGPSSVIELAGGLTAAQATSSGFLGFPAQVVVASPTVLATVLLLDHVTIHPWLSGQRVAREHPQARLSFGSCPCPIARRSASEER